MGNKTCCSEQGVVFIHIPLTSVHIFFFYFYAIWCKYDNTVKTGTHGAYMIVVCIICIDFFAVSCLYARYEELSVGGLK